VPADSHALDRRYRYFYRPVIFIACLLPALGCLGGILRSSGLAALPAFDLGADPVRFVLDRLAKSALNLLFLTLLVTPLRVLTGNANLLRLRRMLGLFTFSYALLHFLVYLGPYESFNGVEIGKDLLKRPFISIGFVALLLLVPLAVTSSNRMMRRLKRRWQQLHRLIYLIAALAVLHFWKMLKHEYREPLLYAALLGTLLGFRAWWWWWRRWRASHGAAPADAAPGGTTSRFEPPRARETAAGAAPWQDS